MKTCVFGGHYGSEGKGSMSEWLAKNRMPSGDTGHPDNEKFRKLVVCGDNSPNSGHTCSLGKTRNVPAAGFFADVIMLGPDSVIDVEVLLADLDAIVSATGQAPLVIVHEHAAVVTREDKKQELAINLVDRVASTGTGSGAARFSKQFGRYTESVMASLAASIRDDVRVVNNSQWFDYIRQFDDYDWIFECSQGALLDVNWGRYPFVTSRTTQPRVAIERNGFGGMKWEYIGVYRTFPIRTGGNSGPTGGAETTFEELGFQAEVATVTKRTRRIFTFDPDDFRLSLQITRPDKIAFTHLDYLNADPRDLAGFLNWLPIDSDELGEIASIYLSRELGQFTCHNGKVTN